jgi:hypothetical protein
VDTLAFMQTVMVKKESQSVHLISTALGSQTPLEAQRMAERVTHPTIGVSCCPVAGIPAPNDTADIEELTHELNLE